MDNATVYERQEDSFSEEDGLEMFSGGDDWELSIVISRADWTAAGSPERIAVAWKPA